MIKPLSVRNLSFSYPDGNKVLNNISFEIENTHQTVCLLGPNGAGKTTLLLCLCGILECDGEIEIFGEKLNKENFGKIRKKIGFLFQNPDDQFFMPTVFEDVSFGISQEELSKGEVKLKVKSLLEQVGISDSFDRSPHHLSFGEKKRVSLAGVLITNPQIMFLDEPTLGLDPVGRRLFINIIKKIEVPKLISTHDVSLASELSDKIVFIENSRIVKQGPAQVVLSSEELSHFLDINR